MIAQAPAGRSTRIAARSASSALRLNSSLRCRPPAQTWQLASTLMADLGISRVTDITRMDRLGLPVFASVRPRGQVLRVHAGKGIETAEAQVGALMEAVEYAVADPAATRWQGRSLSRQELARLWHGLLSWDDLPRRVDADWPAEAQVLTVVTEDLRTGQPVPLPAELVFFPFESAPQSAVFGSNTTGLASGNSVDEATLHGLLEVLERDALSMNKPRDCSLWLRLNSLPAPVRGLARRWQRLGVKLAVRYVPNDFGLPCFDATLFERDGAPIELAAGSGLHFDPQIALVRAVCEAAQSRLSSIHGGRDDLTRFYDQLGDPAARAAAIAQQCSRRFNRRQSIGFDEIAVPIRAYKTLPATLRGLLRHLEQQGFSTVLRYQFERPLNGLAVVKVVVPRCEDVEHNSRRIGKRLRSLLMLRSLPQRDG